MVTARKKGASIRSILGRQTLLFRCPPNPQTDAAGNDERRKQRIERAGHEQARAKKTTRRLRKDISLDAWRLTIPNHAVPARKDCTHRLLWAKFFRAAAG